jgi:hypothetical protein
MDGRIRTSRRPRGRSGTTTHDRHFAYWHVDCDSRAARSMGQMANVLIAMVLLTQTKNSVWTIVFGNGIIFSIMIRISSHPTHWLFLGVSWDEMLVFHQVIGYSILIAIAIHMLLWWKVYALNHSFPHDIFYVPEMYHSDVRDLMAEPFTPLTSNQLHILLDRISLYRWHS